LISIPKYTEKSIGKLGNLVNWRVKKQGMGRTIFIMERKVGVATPV